MDSLTISGKDRNYGVNGNYLTAMTFRTLISLVLLAILAGLTSRAFAGRGAVMIEILEGETAFMVDEQAHKVWWVVGECRRPVPLEAKKTSKTMTSEIISNDVRLGSHHITLEQQFRFNLANPPASVDIFNSVRGGWSSVPVQVQETCSAKPTCRARMELPEC